MRQRSPLRLLFLFVQLSACTPLYPRTEPAPETTGWRTQPVGRGTFQIVLSCILTLGLCVWTSIHPNVKGGVGAMTHFKDKCALAGMALFMPEKTVSQAWDEWTQTRALYRALIYESWVKNAKNEQAEVEQREGWKGMEDKIVKVLRRLGAWVDDDAFPKQVAFLVIMGGFVRLENGKEIAVTASELFHAFKEGTIFPVTPTPRPVAGPVEKEGIEGGIVATETKSHPFVRLDEKHGHESGMVIRQMQLSPDTRTDGEGRKTTAKSPIGIKISDIRDKGKSSVLAKLIIFGQVGWMLLQLIGRRVSLLPMTLLELQTLIHIVIAVIIFWFWFHKPLDVGDPIVLALDANPKQNSNWSDRPQRFQSKGIRQYIDYLWLSPQPEILRVNSPPEVKTSIHSGPPLDSKIPAPVVPKSTFSSIIPKPLHVLNPPKLNPTEQPAATSDNNTTSFNLSKRIRVWKAESGNVIWENSFPCIFYFVYAGLHAIAWSEYFSTEAEEWFWRGSCLVVGIAPTLVVCSVILFNLLYQLTSGSGTVKGVQGFVHQSMNIIYLLASIGLVIEGIISLRRLPINVYYTVPWTAYIPHF